MSIEYFIINNSKDKKIYKEEVQDIFELVYQKKLNNELWQHQFINSPYDNTVLFLAKDIENKQVIGTSLMILQKSIIENKEYKYFLFTTSTILKEYRNKGIYAELLKKQKEFAIANKVDFILAFPNKLAYPVLKLFGGFKDIKKINLVKTNFDNIDFDSSSNSLVIDNEMFKWRFEHKKYLFYNRKNKVIIFKEFDGAYDILAIYEKQYFDYDFVESNINTSLKINVLEENIKNINEIEVIDTLNATCFPINKTFDYKKIKINLLMSDVF